MTTQVDLAVGDATRLASAVLQAVGTPGHTAEFVAHHLVDADLSGHSTHGIGRLPWYVKYVRDGVVDPTGEPQIEERGILPVVSASWGFSHPAAELAMQTACAQAREQGLGAAGLIRATHVGRLGAYAEAAASQGMIGIIMYGGMGGGRLLAPPGSVTGLLGANPLALAFPADDEPPLAVDFTVASVTIGRIVQAQNAQQRLATKCLLEPDGTPTDDPSALDRGGAIQAFGGHKGFALGVAIEILTRILLNTERYAEEPLGGPSFRHAGGLFIALRPDAFAVDGAVGDGVKALREQIRSATATDPDGVVMAPGDPEIRSRRKNTTLSIRESDWSLIQRIASDLGLHAVTPSVTT